MADNWQNQDGEGDAAPPKGGARLGRVFSKPIMRFF